MNPNLQNILNQLRNLPLVSPKFCNNCGHPHSTSDLVLLGQHENMISVQISCQSCGLLHVVKINLDMPGMVIQRMEVPVNDVSPIEFRKFAFKPKVEKDEALNAYQDMQKVQGLQDFLNLFPGSSQ